MAKGSSSTSKVYHRPFYAGKELDAAVEGAYKYAAADRSDPFALNRALSHIKTGFAGVHINERQDKVVAGYGADHYREQRAVYINSVRHEYTADAYRNVYRP